MRLSRTRRDRASSTTPVEMQFPLFLPEKLLGPSPRHVPQIKPATRPPRVHPTTSESLLARTRVVVYSFETVLGMAGDPEKSFHEPSR